MKNVENIKAYLKADAKLLILICMEKQLKEYEELEKSTV